MILFLKDFETKSGTGTLTIELSKGLGLALFTANEGHIFILGPFVISFSY